MPEVEYSTVIRLSRETIWAFVSDMNNWAPMLTGYQSHQILDETDSIWTLKGDVGVLSRTVQLKAHVTEWNGPDKVSFTLTGLNEIVEGGGTLRMIEAEAGTINEAPKIGFLARVIRFFFRLIHGKGPARQLSGGQGPSSRLSFTLRMDAGGPMGPMVNAMLGPALLPAAEDLANKIAAHLEKVHSRAA